MGGSNQGGSSFPSMRNDEFNCKNFTTVVSLNSPDEQVIENIEQDFLLDIGLDDETGSVVAYWGDNIAGAVTIPQIAKFIACINEGVNYKGRVISLSGGQCTLKIFASEDD